MPSGSEAISRASVRAASRSSAALETLNHERAVMPAMCLGIIKRCVEESIRYAGQREGRLDARLASLAKLYCAEEAVRVSLDAIQIHGGAGYMAELPLEKPMRDAKNFEIRGGTNEIQLQTIARSILKESDFKRPPRKSSADVPD